MSIPRRGVCLVLAAPAGAGKTTISRALLAQEPELRLSVSWTTRAPRGGEQDGVHYHFRTQAQFDAHVAEAGFLEHAHVLGRHSYGTPRGPVEAALAAGQDVLFDIDWQGFRQVRAAMPADVVGTFILPPSRAELLARLKGRGTDSAEEIDRRMALAGAEMSHAPEFDHVLVNADFDAAVDDVRAVLRAARLARSRLPGLEAFLEALSASC